MFLIFFERCHKDSRNTETDKRSKKHKKRRKKKIKQKIKTKIAVGLYKKKVEKDISTSKFKHSKRV